MQRQNIIQTLAWTAGTCALALALLGGNTLQADDPPATQPVAKDTSLQVIDPKTGTAMHVAFADPDAKAEPGKNMPTVNLIAQAPEGKDVTLTIQYQLQTTVIPSPMQRTPAFPRTVTSGSEQLVLKAGETLTIPLAIKARLLEGNSYEILLSSDASESPFKPMAQAMTFDLERPQDANVLYDDQVIPWTTDQPVAGDMESPNSLGGNGQNRPNFAGRSPVPGAEANEAREPGVAPQALQSAQAKASDAGTSQAKTPTTQPVALNYPARGVTTNDAARGQ